LEGKKLNLSKPIQVKVKSMPSCVIGFYGPSNAGKTTLIVRLIQTLTKEGYSVATVKQTEKNIGLDCEGKDTWSHSQAGAKVVVFSSPVETDIIVKKKQTFTEILHQITAISSYDCIFVEGATDRDILKIRVGKSTKRENTIVDYNGDFTAVLSLIKKKIKENTDIERKESVSVLVNGKEIPLTEFPSSVIKNTVVGLLQSLKGVDTIREIKLTIRC